MTSHPVPLPRQLGRASGERGSASIQYVILMPALFLLMFLGLQSALVHWGRTAAMAAAQEGAREAARETGSASEGISAARAFATTSTATLKGVGVSGFRSGTDAGVTVTATTLSVLPGFSFHVTQSATMPVERVTG